MSFGEILDVALKIYRENFAVVFGMSLAYALPVAVVSQLVGLGKPVVRGQPPSLGPIAIVGLLQLVGWIVVGGLATALVAQVVENKPTKLGDLLARMSGLWGSYAWTTLKFAFLCMLCFMALVVPGIIYYFRRSLWNPAMVFEGGDGSRALERSKTLIGKLNAGRADKVLLVSLVVIVVQWALMTGLNAIVPTSLGIARLVSSLPQAVCIPLIPITVALLYVDARVRDEGYDLALRTGVVDVAPPSVA